MPRVDHDRWTPEHTEAVFGSLSNGDILRQGVNKISEILASYPEYDIPALELRFII